MSNGIDFGTAGIGQVRVAGNWLDANGRLPVCIGKPPKRIDEIPSDGIVPDIATFAEAILERNGQAVSPLQGWFLQNAGLLLFPEYAFSSRDFTALNRLVREHPTRLIVMAGFGAVLGSELSALLQGGCEASWQGGATAIIAQARYNAGWCWIHESPGNTHCFLFLKNFIDQAVEISEVQNLSTVESILRIETDDLVLYPLICSDLICQQGNGPRIRIAQSLPQRGKRVAVCTISCNSSPHSGWWRAAIDDVVGMQNQNAVLIFANQNVTMAQPDEENDRWRCLSGVFISRTRMPKAPRRPLPHVRHVATEAVAGGLILRHPDEGVAVGMVGWDLSSPGVGLYVWEPRLRLVWRSHNFVPFDSAVEYYETRRYLERRSSGILLNFPQAEGRLATSLAAIASETDQQRITPRLWPELLDGPQPSEPPRSADDLHMDQADLDLAFGVFAAVQFATSGTPLHEGPERGQLLWEAKELRVWRSPRFRDQQMINSLQKLALDGGSAPPLIVIGRGRPLGNSAMAQQIEAPAQQAIPEKQTDFTNAVSRAGVISGIESTRPRLVFWQPMGEVEQVLLNPPVALAPALCSAIIRNLNFA
jgi:hypothetical protein